MLHADPRELPAEFARGSLRKSLFLHLAVLGTVLALPYLHTPPKVEEPPAIQAVLIQQQPVVHEPVVQKPVETPPPPIPEKIEIPEPVREPPKIALPKLPEKPEKKPEPPRPLLKKPLLDTAKLDAEMENMQRELQQAEMERMRQEAEKSATAMRISANQAIVARYRGLISQRIETKWNRPLSAHAGMVVTLRINMIPGGEVTNVVITTPSGDAAFDASAEEAVRRASPLPVPEDVAVFNQNFRTFTLKFRPEDL